MTLRDILKQKGSKVWTIREDQTIHEVVHVLVQQKIGALVVRDRENKLVGIISERDIIRGCYYTSRELDSVPVEKLMTRKVIVAFPDEEIRHAMELMTENRVRHIPVVDGGELAGIVSIGDIVKSLLQESESQIQHLKDFISGSR